MTRSAAVALLDLPRPDWPALLSGRGRPTGRWVQHVLFWLAVLAFYTLYFGQRGAPYGQSLLFVLLLLPCTIAATYLVVYVLVPRYLLTRRFGRFALFFTYTLVGSLYLEMWMVLLLYVNVADYQALVISTDFVDVLDALVGMYLVVFLAMALSGLRRWYGAQQQNERLARARLEAELKLKEAELKLLRSQIHPHFLFNTLNNLYALTLAKSDHAPDAVLRMSETLDYILYRTEARTVPLQDELAHLRNYIELERLRYGDRLEVTITVEGDPAGFPIAPLLLLPLVENAFKHGVSQSSADGWIRFEVHADGDHLRATVANSCPSHAASSALTDGGGIGLTNVRQRLALLYPDAHRLSIGRRPDAYHVTLEVTGTPRVEAVA